MRRDHNIGLVVAARFISRVGGEAAFFVGIWGKAAFEFDASATSIAVLMASVGVATIVGTATAGVLVDRFDPRRVVIAAELFFVPATLAMVLATSMPQLAFFGALFGFTGAPVFTAISSFAPYLTEERERLHTINSWIESAGMAAFIGGPAVGAMIVRYASIDWIFVVDAATSVVAVALVVPVRLRVVAHAERTSPWAEVREGIRYTYASRQLRYYVLMGTALWLTFGSFAALEPLFYRDVLGVDVEALGWVTMVFGFGLLFGSAILPKMPAALKTTAGLTTIIVANALGVLLYVGTSKIAVVVVGAIVWGTVIGLFAPLHRTLLHLNSPDEMVGRIASTVAAHAHGAELIPLAIVPGLAGIFGVQQVLLGAGALLALIGLSSMREARAIDRMRTKPVPPASGLLVADEPISPTP